MGVDTNPGGPQPIERPHQITELDPDQLVAAILRLTMEISVLRDRLATHEQLLADHGLNAQAIDEFRPSAEERQRRAAARMHLIDSVMKDLS
jgi:hypothetical protein